VTWSQDGSQLMLQIQNREQTWLDLVATDPKGMHGRVLFRDRTPAWIESPGDPVLLNNGDFIWRSPRTGYSHLYRYNKDGKHRRRLGSPFADRRRPKQRIRLLHGYQGFTAGSPRLSSPFGRWGIHPDHRNGR